MSAATTTPVATAETGAGAGIITSALRRAAVPTRATAMHRRAAGGIHPRAVRNMAAAASTAVEASTGVAPGTGVAVTVAELRRFPATRVDAAAVAARTTDARPARNDRASIDRPGGLAAARVGTLDVYLDAIAEKLSREYARGIKRYRDVSL